MPVDIGAEKRNYVTHGQTYYTVDLASSKLRSSAFFTSAIGRKKEDEKEAEGRVLKTVKQNDEIYIES